MYMEGARWDMQTGMIQEARLKELAPSMPVIFIKAIPVDRQVNDILVLLLFSGYSVQCLPLMYCFASNVCISCYDNHTLCMVSKPHQ